MILIDRNVSIEWSYLIKNPRAEYGLYCIIVDQDLA